MRCRELQTRYWLLEVYQEMGQEPLFDILFANVDPTLDHLRRELRVLVEKEQALLARSRGKAASDQRQWRNYNS
jgi:hypothetical protein